MLGAQSVVLLTVGEDLNDRDFHHAPARTEVPTEIRGCRFRMTSSTETSEAGNRKVRESWKLTAPAIPAMLSATARDEIRHGTTTYKIIGTPLVSVDMQGRPHHVTVTCERFIG